MLEIILTILAVAGGGGYIVGRWIMVHDSGGDLGTIWNLALRYIPLAELMFLVRFYNQAKRGGFICIAGMWLMVPWLGNSLWQEQKMNSDEMAKFEGEQASSSVLHEDEDDGDEEAGGSGGYYSQSQVTQKQQKVALLQSRLSFWYQQMQQRRATLGTDPAAIRAFNDEATAYGALNAVAKEESAELAALKSGKQGM